MTPPHVVVVGSANLDLVLRVERLPPPGATVLGTGPERVCGGKGANQAVAAARLGARTSFVGRVGLDDAGRALRTALLADHVDITHLGIDPDAPTGTALVTVAADGSNTVVVSPGANDRLRPADLPAALLGGADVVVVSLEIPLETVAAAVRYARRVVLNAAPARELPKAVMSAVDVIVVNEDEATTLGAAVGLAKALVQTQGAAGCLVAGGAGLARRIAAPSVDAVDTVGAGDCATAALAVALAEGRTVVDACRFAMAAAAQSVTRHGAQAGMPTRAEVDAAGA